MFTIFTKENCKWCVLAKKEFKKRKLPFEERNIPENISKEEFQYIAEQYDTRLTVPKIFKGKDLIGGYEDLLDYFDRHDGGVGEGKL